MFDVATGKQVGTFAYECFLVDVQFTLYHCPDATITLTGRGQIVFTEVIQHEPGKPPAIAPITGGTGEFLGRHGRCDRPGALWGRRLRDHAHQVGARKGGRAWVHMTWAAGCWPAWRSCCWRRAAPAARARRWHRH
jgi:hypothetical protein